jgi:hypothetical protein
MAITPPRRERDETRVFKKMGSALGFGGGGGAFFHDSVTAVDPSVHRAGTSYDANPGDRIVPRDNNESGPMIREDIAAGNRKARDAWVENTNKQIREKGKTPIIRIDSDPTRMYDFSDTDDVSDAEISEIDEGNPLPRKRKRRRR